MTLPPNIRVNVGVPFPALVVGSGPITLSKSNGVWTVGFDIADLATENITSGNSANQFVVIWDSGVGSFFKSPASTFSAAAATGRTQTIITTTPYTVLSADQDVFSKMAVAAAVAITLPAASGRNGVSVRVKDMLGDAGAHNITITAAGTDLMDNGGTTAVINTNFDEMELVPVQISGQWYWSIQ